MGKMTVSKLADQVGTSADTLRYYERIGLLPAPERSPSGYRLYDETAVELVTFIKTAQQLGLRLDDIRELSEIKERGMCPCGHTRALLQQRLANLDEEMAAIGRLRDDIEAMLEVPSPASMQWQCTDDLLQIRPTKRPNTSKGGDT